MKCAPRPTGSLILAVGLLAFTPACSDGIDSAAEAERLMEASREWSRSAEAGDIERMLSYWTDDAVILSPGEPERRGKAAIREHLKSSFALPGFEVRWKPIRAEVSSSGDLGYVLERTQVSVTGPDGLPLIQSYRGLTIWRKDANGNWRNSLEVTNEPPRAGP